MACARLRHRYRSFRGRSDPGLRAALPIFQCALPPAEVRPVPQVGGIEVDGYAASLSPRAVCVGSANDQWVTCLSPLDPRLRSTGLPGPVCRHDSDHREDRIDQRRNRGEVGPALDSCFIDEQLGVVGQVATGIDLRPRVGAGAWRPRTAPATVGTPWSAWRGSGGGISRRAGRELWSCERHADELVGARRLTLRVRE